MFLSGTLFPYISRLQNIKKYPQLFDKGLGSKKQYKSTFAHKQRRNLGDLRTVILRYIIIKSSVYVNSYFITHSIYF